MGRKQIWFSSLGLPAWGVMVFALAAVFLFRCTQPAPEPKSEAQPSRHEYKDIKPEVVPVPEKVRAALPGLVNDNIYLYLEIAPTLNLLAYVPDYSPAKAIEMCARAFVALAEDPEPRLRQGVEFWIIQIQPEPPKEERKEKAEGEPQKSQLVVWGVRPSEADAYRQSANLAQFLAHSEYLLLDDEIIPAGEGRLKPFPELFPATGNSTPSPPSSPAPPSTDPSTPSPGPAPPATPSPGGTE